MGGLEDWRGLEVWENFSFSQQIILNIYQYQPHLSQSLIPNPNLKLSKSTASSSTFQSPVKYVQETRHPQFY